MAPVVSLVVPYYRNPRMLVRQLLVWRDEWPAALKQDLEVVLVDDGSPDETAADVLAVMWGGDRAGLPAIGIWRVLEDRPWHQHGARNLGAHVASGAWLLMTDMDHVVPASSLAELLRLVPGLGDREVVTFGRVDAPENLTWRADHWAEFPRTRRPDGSLKPHPNSFAVSRARYWSLGGYDEDLCGVYGTDIDFRRRLFGPGSAEHHLGHAPLVQVLPGVIADANTRGVVRKAPGQAALKRAIRARKILEGRADRPTALAFPWERVDLDGGGIGRGDIRSAAAPG